jgi:hypothetical protein
VKIVIGITQDPEKIQVVFSEYKGKPGSLTEVGPFVSKEDVLKWLNCLKGKIGDIEEIKTEQELSIEAVWYGFTFEQGPII